MLSCNDYYYIAYCLHIIFFIYKWMIYLVLFLFTLLWMTTLLKWNVSSSENKLTCTFNILINFMQFVSNCYWKMPVRICHTIEDALHKFYIFWCWSEPEFHILPPNDKTETYDIEEIAGLLQVTWKKIYWSVLKENFRNAFEEQIQIIVNQSDTFNRS